MHPVEALKARVLEMKETILSKGAIRQALIKEGHAEGLVDAAIEVAFAGRLEAREAAAQKDDEQERRSSIAQVLGSPLLTKVERAGAGAPRGAARVSDGFVRHVVTASVGLSLAVGVATLPKSWAIPVALLLLGGGLFAGFKASQAWPKRGLTLVVCTEGLVEVSPDGELSTHDWDGVVILNRSRRNYEDDQGRHRKTTHVIGLSLPDGRRFNVSGDDRGTAVFSAALASQAAASERRA